MNQSLIYPCLLAAMPLGSIAAQQESPCPHDVQRSQENPVNPSILAPGPVIPVGANTPRTTDEAIAPPSVREKEQALCAKLPMAADGIVRLSTIEVKPEYLDSYIPYAVEVGEISLRTEPGVLTMYAVRDKNHPCTITILETYASRKAYQSHIASKHFQKYKQATLHMIQTLTLSDQTPLNTGHSMHQALGEEKK